MRVTDKVEKIEYSETQKFFDARAKKISEENPYSVTMYQDNDPELVKARNEKETSKLLPKLKLDSNSEVLDVACGIGRWSDAINTEIKKYCGCDFCEGLIDYASQHNTKANRHFYVSRNELVAKTIQANQEGMFNRVLLIGALVYLNDEDVIKTFEGIESLCEENAIICVREPVGIEHRLTLKEFFSEELNDYYNAIYRTRDELNDLFKQTFLKNGFSVLEEDFMFEDAKLNNRKETAQYYYILQR